MEQTIMRLGRSILASILFGAVATVVNATVPSSTSPVVLSGPTAKMRGLGITTHPLHSHIESATGVRVLLQVWNPAAPDKNDVVTLVDEPTLLSDSLQDAWMQSRLRICEQIKGRMGVAGAANGQTLYDITCELDQRVALEVSSGGPNTVRATFLVGGYLEATSTTPGPLGSYADPRISIAITAKFELTLAIQPNRDQTLQVSRALFSLNNAKLDSHNFTGDLLKFISDDLIPFFGGPNFKKIAEDAVNQISIDLSDRFNSALAPVNAKLQGPSDAVRVGVSGSGGFLSVAFAPREIPPPTGGSLNGLLHWDPSQFEPRMGCSSFEIHATVQTGPVPMFAPNASAPTREVGHLDISSVDERTCRFTLSGLAPGWPNVLTTRVVGGNTGTNTGSSVYKVSYSLVGDGWSGRIVTPQPTANGNYLVGRSIDATAIKSPDYSSAKRVVESETNARINPSDTVSLNPPKANSATQTKTSNPGTTNGIIIVSGQQDPLARKPVVDYPRSSGLDPAVISKGQVQSAVSPNFEQLATRGAELAKDDQETLELLNQQTVGPAHTGFYIGLAAAEGQTLPGPGKQKIHDSLPSDQQQGFATAVTFSLARNRKKLTALALRGAEIATQDPLAQQLRDQQSDDATRLGFDIGMAAAEGQTLLGPGKEKTCAGLQPTAEQAGCRIAVLFSVDRNRNAKLAETGAAIAQADQAVADLRNAEKDVFYRMGFDIATGIFGNPALGARGNTATGPGSLGIRDALNAAAQRGFNASVKLHLSRKYAHPQE